MKIPESEFTPAMERSVAVMEAFVQIELDPFASALVGVGLIRAFCDRLASREVDVDKDFFVEFIQATDLDAFADKWIDKGRD